MRNLRRMKKKTTGLCSALFLSPRTHNTLANRSRLQTLQCRTPRVRYRPTSSICSAAAVTIHPTGNWKHVLVHYSYAYQQQRLSLARRGLAACPRAVPTSSWPAGSRLPPTPRTSRQPQTQRQRAVPTTCRPLPPGPDADGSGSLVASIDPSPLPHAARSPINTCVPARSSGQATSSYSASSILP